MQLYLMSKHSGLVLLGYQKAGHFASKKYLLRFEVWFVERSEAPN